MNLPDAKSLVVSDADNRAALALITDLVDGHVSWVDGDDTVTTIARSDDERIRVRVHQQTPGLVLGIERVDPSLTPEAGCALVAAVCGRELIEAIPPPWLVDLATGRAFRLNPREVDARAMQSRYAARLQEAVALALDRTVTIALTLRDVLGDTRHYRALVRIGGSADERTESLAREVLERVMDREPVFERVRIEPDDVTIVVAG